MQFTRLHINAVGVALATVGGSLAAAMLAPNHPCLPSDILLAGMGIAVIFARQRNGKNDGTE